MFVKFYPDTFEFSCRIWLDDLPTKEWTCANINSASFCPCSLQEIAIFGTIATHNRELGWGKSETETGNFRVKAGRRPEQEV